MSPFLDRPIAHRGLHDKKLIIENSLEAFENAMEHNLAIECDIVLSKDKEIIVFHDYDLKRMCGINSNINDLSTNEIRKLKLLDTDCKIPSLDEMLHLVDGQTPILIEIKSGFNPEIEERLIEIIRAYNGEIALQSFDYKMCEWFKINAPFYKTGLITSNDNIDFKEISHLGINFLAVDVEKISMRNIQSIRKENIPLLTWTINSTEKYNLSKKFADNIIFEDIHNEIS